MKKRNILVACVLIGVFVIASSFAVYSATMTKAILTNRITFTPDNVYVKVNAKVYYDGESDNPISTYEGRNDKVGVQMSAWDLPDTLNLSLTKSKLVYEFTICNLTANKKIIAYFSDFDKNSITLENGIQKTAKVQEFEKKEVYYKNATDFTKDTYQVIDEAVYNQGEEEDITPSVIITLTAYIPPTPPTENGYVNFNFENSFNLHFEEMGETD